MKKKRNTADELRSAVTAGRVSFAKSPAADWESPDVPEINGMFTHVVRDVRSGAKYTEDQRQWAELERYAVPFITGLAFNHARHILKLGNKLPRRIR